MGELAHLHQPKRDEILTRPELALEFKVSVRTVDRWVESGCPSVTWGMRVRRFYLAEVQQWLRRRAA